MYIVILRNPEAEQLLRGWVRENRIEHATVTGNKLMLHHQQAFENFCLTWSHDWEVVTIWDTWHKRHIYV